jgi:hypothetical protein
MSVLSSSSAFCISFIQQKESDFFSNLYRGSPHSPSRNTNPPEGREASHEPLNVLDVPNWTHLGDGRDLIRVCFDATLGDDVPQELPPRDSECAFFRVQLNVEPSEVVEGLFQVRHEAAALLRFLS